MRFVDADALIETMEGHVTTMSVCSTMIEARAKGQMKQTCIADVANAPTVDVIPVEWLRKYTAVGVAPTGDRLTEGDERLAIHRILNEWKKEQEA